MLNWWRKKMLLNENEEVLKSLGYFPGQTIAPRRIDFSIVFQDEEARLAALPQITAAGFRCELSDEGVDADCPEAVAHKVMLPSAELITNEEWGLNELLKDYDARTDGWGFFGDTEH
jgi:Regulator of ribonuclease activity B